MGKNVFVPYWNLYILLENQEVVSFQDLKVKKPLMP